MPVWACSSENPRSDRDSIRQAAPCMWEMYEVFSAQLYMMLMLLFATSCTWDVHDCRSNTHSTYHPAELKQKMLKNTYVLSFAQYMGISMSR